eukprot:TRINITY_DN15162_c0_g1_i1.p1 TRINITY_DN15162_c0_g1~~TRINITY_DN15162_c0_g1_i1.p1  ORF type:complete len:310 (+),score=81.70 TRINITY_DN15162_c0_g1_i1:649-1578(+)
MEAMVRPSNDSSSNLDLLSSTKFSRSSIGGSSTSENSIFIKNVEVKHLIGTGNFGNVMLGIWNGTTQVAMKQLKTAYADMYEKEVLVLMRLNHPNVIRLLGICTQEEQQYMILEYCPLGSLSDFLQSEETILKLTVVDKLLIILDISSGMNYLEEEKIIHRDLSARNILVVESGKRYIAKISDFGQSKESEYYYGGKNLAIKWSSPETIKFNKSSSKSDVWSFGITCWEIMSNGEIPYQGMSNAECVQKVKDGYRLERPDGCPQNLFEIMEECWKEAPSERPTFREIYQKNSISSSGCRFVSRPRCQDL